MGNRGEQSASGYAAQIGGTAWLYGGRAAAGRRKQRRAWSLTGAGGGEWDGTGEGNSDRYGWGGGEAEVYCIAAKSERTSANWYRRNDQRPAVAGGEGKATTPLSFGEVHHVFHRAGEKIH